MSEGSKVLVGLNVRKDSISVAVGQCGQQPGPFVGIIAHDVPKLLEQLVRIAPPGQMTTVYEAGPTGYGLRWMRRRAPAMRFACQPAQGTWYGRRAAGPRG